MERDTNRSKGFAFVEMETEEGAQQAIAGLNEQDFQGRPLRVNEARPRPERKPFNRNNRYWGNEILGLLRTFDRFVNLIQPPCPK